MKVKLIVVILMTFCVGMCACSQRINNKDGSMTIQTSEIKGSLDFTPLIAGISAYGGGAVVYDGGNEVIDRGVCWNTGGTPTISDPKVSDGAGIGEFYNCELSGLSAETIYYVRAYAVSSAGTAYGQVISFNTGKEFGTINQGGLVFYNDGEGHGLVATPESAEFTSIFWGKYNTLIGGTGKEIGTGNLNTIKIVAILNASPAVSNTAAQLCAAYSDGTYSDWFLPSSGELYYMYTNLKVNGFGGFAEDEYWSSSETDKEWVLSQYFVDGELYDGIKSSAKRVRAVRAF